MRKQIYEIITHPSIFEREKAIEIYKRMNLIKKQTGLFINVLKKANTPNIGGKIENLSYLVGKLRQEFHSTLIKGEKDLVRKDFKISFPIQLFASGADLKEALRYLKDRVQRERADRKFYPNEYPIHYKTNFWFKKMVERKYRSLDENKRPQTEDKYIGIEIECIIPVDSDIKNLMLPFSKYVSLAGDGSIDPSEFNGGGYDHTDSDCNDPDDCDGNHGENEYEGKEIRILVKQSELSTIVPQVCGVLEEIGAKVNKSCGLHVHFDMRDTTQVYRNEVYAKLYHALPLLTKIVPKSRRNNTFCKRNRRSVPNYNGTRYRMINATSYYKHNTFEIRLFNSTINSSKIINWVKLLQKVMSSEMFLRCPSSFKKAKQTWKLSNELVTWAEERQEKFKDTVPVVIEQSNTIETRELATVGGL